MQIDEQQQQEEELENQDANQIQASEEQKVEVKENAVAESTDK